MWWGMMPPKQSITTQSGTLVQGLTEPHLPTMTYGFFLESKNLIHKPGADSLVDFLKQGKGSLAKWPDQSQIGPLQVWAFPNLEEMVTSSVEECTPVIVFFWFPCNSICSKRKLTGLSGIKRCSGGPADGIGAAAQYRLTKNGRFLGYNPPKVFKNH